MLIARFEGASGVPRVVVGLTCAPHAHASRSGGGTSSSGALCGVTDGGVKFYGPTKYLSAADSPFPCAGANQFALETLEDDSFDIPGAAFTGVLTYPAYGAITDSVDSDDGVIDGDCHRADAGRYCQSIFGSNVTVTFGADAGGFDGGLPTFAGLVWTDGSGEVSFEAYGPDGGSLGVLGPFHADDAGFPGSGITRETDEDRFFGVAFGAGISKLRISNTGGPLEMDHVQAGR